MKEAEKQPKKDEGWVFICHFGLGEVWGKGKERILYEPNEDRIIMQYTED